MNRVVLAVVGIAVGVGLGLLYSRVLSPVEYVNTGPDSLRGSDQANYIKLVARAYSVEGDAGRARTRLALLGLANPAQSVAALAQRSVADGTAAGTVRALADLAAALGAGPVTATQPAATIAPTPGGQPSAQTSSPGATASPSAAPARTTAPTITVIPSITPRFLPTRTPTALPPGAFDFAGRQLVCDPALGQPLIQVLTENVAGQAVPGVEVVVTWSGGFDHFFTGLKPDLGLGYGDFTMTPGIDYALHLAESPAVSIEGLTVENCSTPTGDTYPGSWLLVFRQP